MVNPDSYREVDTPHDNNNAQVVNPDSYREVDTPHDNNNAQVVKLVDTPA